MRTETTKTRMVAELKKQHVGSGLECSRAPLRALRMVNLYSNAHFRRTSWLLNLDGRRNTEDDR
jgi:hypothetical protein